MIFYFIGVVPRLEKSVNDHVYLSVDDAIKIRDWFNDRVPPYTYKIYEAEAVNIREALEVTNQAQQLPLDTAHQS